MQPGGDVIVTGYPQLIETPSRWDPWIAAISVNCAGILRGDIPMLRRIGVYLNDQIRDAVEDADREYRDEDVRFHFVDIAADPYESSDEQDDHHGLCSGDSWINGLSPGIDKDSPRPLGSFHPKQIGHTMTAAVVADLIREEVVFDDISEANAPETWQLTPEGIGPLEIGMTEEEARDAGVDLKVEPGPYCNAWEVPGLRGISMFAPKSTDELTSISLIDPPAGHGAEGIEIGDSLADAQAAFGTKLKLVEKMPPFAAFYRVSSPATDSSIQFQVDSATGEIGFEETGLDGTFYYVDGVELCA